MYMEEQLKPTEQQTEQTPPKPPLQDIIRIEPLEIIEINNKQHGWDSEGRYI